MKILLPLFRFTVMYERLDFITDLIVKMGGKKNYDKFYDLDY